MIAFLVPMLCMSDILLLSLLLTGDDGTDISSSGRGNKGGRGEGHGCKDLHDQLSPESGMTSI